MLHDDHKNVRNLAFERIMNARKLQKSQTPRRFTVPTLNFGAKVYYDLINWTKVNITEPPLTKKLNKSELRDLVENGEKSELWEAEIFQLPCHTQATERCVKLVTEVSTKVAHEQRRDGYIRTVLASRSRMPKFHTKSDFRVIQ